MKPNQRVLLAIALVSLPATAHASAWTQARGKGQIILTGVYSSSERGFDTNGRIVDIPRYEKQELYLLAEYGVTDDLTVIVTPSLRRVRVGDDAVDNTSGFGYTELGGRYRVASGDRWVASLQASVRIPGARRADTLAQVGSTDAEYDVRALGGTSFTLGGMNGFLDVQGGYRLRAGDPPNEFRADATVGIRPSQPLLVYGQIFNVISDGNGQGVFSSYRYHNAHLNVAYDLDDRWTLQVGGVATVGGRNALRERGLTAGVWLRF